MYKGGRIRFSILGDQGQSRKLRAFKNLKNFPSTKRTTRFVPEKSAISLKNWPKQWLEQLRSILRPLPSTWLDLVATRRLVLAQPDKSYKSRETHKREREVEKFHFLLFLTRLVNREQMRTLLVHASEVKRRAESTS